MYACIDLGSNSFHLLIARWHDGRHDIVERFSEKVQLGECLAETGMITSAAMDRGIACLTTFRHALDRYPITHTWAVGTNALRSAANSRMFLAKAAQLGFSIDIVSGHEEAALVYTGVTSALPESDLTRLVVDIGGGSTELIVGRAEQRLQMHSLSIGCISWRDLWFRDIPVKNRALSKHLDKANAAALNVFRPVSLQLSATPFSEVYASSGTAKMLSAVCRQFRPDASSALVTLDTLMALKPELIRAVLEPGYGLPGLKNSRRDLLLPGWAVFSGFMQATGVEKLEFSPTALREGMLHYQVLSATKGGSPLRALREN
jgi:exopolyphosphatase / guanosine-5'-triphosphate,3'-diphosphate pyrophosphatase